MQAGRVSVGVLVRHICVGPEACARLGGNARWVCLGGDHGLFGCVWVGAAVWACLGGATGWVCVSGRLKVGVSDETE